MDVPTVTRVRVPSTIHVEEGPPPVRDYRTSASTKGRLRIVQGRAPNERWRLVVLGGIWVTLVGIMAVRVGMGTGAVVNSIVITLVTLVVPYIGLRRFFNRTTITIADERLELHVGPFLPGFHGWMFVSTIAAISCEEGEQGHRVVADRIDGLEVPLSEWRRDETEARCIAQTLDAYLGRVVVIEDVA